MIGRCIFLRLDQTIEQEFFVVLITYFREFGDFVTPRKTCRVNTHTTFSSILKDTNTKVFLTNDFFLENDEIKSYESTFNYVMVRLQKS